MRSITGTIFAGEDMNLNSSLFVLYGVGAIVQDPERFFVHGGTPEQIPRLSVQRFNPTLDTNANAVMETVSH